MNVKVSKLKTRATKSRPRSVRKTVARNAAGRFVDIFTLDANSATFDDDLTYVYRANVAKARRENKKIFGSPDGIRVQVRRGSLNAARKK